MAFFFRITITTNNNRSTMPSLLFTIIVIKLISNPQWSPLCFLHQILNITHCLLLLLLVNNYCYYRRLILLLCVNAFLVSLVEYTLKKKLHIFTIRICVHLIKCIIVTNLLNDNDYHCCCCLAGL